MRNIIVGTAGHIDHGKTALVRALTGIDADRLAEEKRRGITIDLGFAHLRIAKDIRIGFIDVPGHERFVRNMLAGAAGIDAVLFVVAADESIKPQTREHFEICRMLGVQAGVVAITKADLVDGDFVDLVRLEFDEFAAGSFLEGAPKIAVSSTTGAGLPELRKALENMARAVREKSASGWFRLPVDRAFTVKGFGTVVTGTLVSGTVRREDEVELYPTGRRLRVRGVQVYGEPADRARAGERTALNLADIEAAEIERGMVLSEAGRFTPVTSFDGRLELLASAKPLKNGAPVHLHIGAAEREGVVRLLRDSGRQLGGRAEALAPRSSAWVRITLREPALILPGDRFIIRRFSPVTTIGGGVVSAIGPYRYPLEALMAGGIDPLIAARPYGISEAELIALTGLKDLPARPLVSKWFLDPLREAQLRTQLMAAVREFHAKQPLLKGIPKQDLKGRVMAAGSADLFEHLLASAKELVQEGELVRARGHRVVLKLDEQQARAAIEAAFESAGLAAPAVGEVLKASGIEHSRAHSILRMLLTERRLTRVSAELVLHVSAVSALRQSMGERKGARFSVPEFKDWAGVSRKYAIPILEYLDREHVTRREGDERIVL
jgi:selenocysteine-specific elongation factor